MPPLRNTGQAPEAEHPDHAGRYLLESALGSGGMGVVHLATSASGLRLAVKVIHTNHASDPEFRARFRQEVAAARRVSGAFTAPVVDADPEAGRPWMATLFIDGPTLSERVKRNGPLGYGELVRLGAGLAEGLRDIHRAGVVHRDLKPSNVLLASDGPKVIDFGISRPVDSDLRTETGKLIGTPPFMAPEQFQRPREVGPAADVFAMGAVLVHAATGRGPFDSDSPYIVAYQVVHDEPNLAGVPEGLVPLITRCLAKDPADRPTPDELMAALRLGDRGGAGQGAADWGGSGRTEGGRETGAPHGASPLVPAQRRPGADESLTPAPAAGATHSPASRLGTRLPQTVQSLAGARRGVRWAAAGAAVVALAVVGVVGVVAVRATGDDAAPPAPARTGTDGSRSGRAFQPWRTELHAGLPVCSAGGSRAGTGTSTGAGVYCAAPGVTAARLDPDDGEVRWTVPTVRASKGAGSGDGGADGEVSDNGAAPVLSGGLLLVVEPAGSRLKALDPASGAERWAVGVASYASVRYTGSSVLLVAYDGTVRALDSATGTERWTARHGGTGTVWTAAGDGSGDSGGDSGGGSSGGPLFAATPSADGTATGIRSVDPATGALRWEKRLPGTLTPAGAASGALFLLSRDLDDRTDAVVRVDASTRTVRRVPLDAPVEQAQATVDGDTVYVMGYTGSLLAVDTRKGKAGGVRWRLETSVTRASRPTATGDRVYLSAGDGRLLAVDGARGRLLGQTKPRMATGSGTLVPSLAAPVAVAGTVFASAPDGSVFAVDGRDPARW
ncbi:protein kinase domain-containing protein [Streptomyces sp. NBC_01429]|uniref:protein kinase domain-containing protein n=1 Tax=Streptomyces sp. NBC_01429 TaxID=2903862 RepID=UPI002E293142|nr:PQQ-binding-like beta-propeller repeat protein [Streptomyces sp. NBC_01429]